MRGTMRKVEAVDRALQLLQEFHQHGQELTVGALAVRLGIHRSTVSRLAGTLAERGFLARAADGDAFRLGPELGRLGMLAVADRDLVRASRAAMTGLAQRTQETVVLSVLDRLEAVDLAQVDGGHRVGTRNWRGQRSPLHASSDGKVLLAFAGVGLEELTVSRLTARTLTGPADLRREIERVRARGWATAVGELEEGLNGVAVPVWDGEDQCVAALSISGPEYRLPPAQLESLAGLAQQAAGEVGAALGRGAGQP